MSIDFDVPDQPKMPHLVIYPHEEGDRHEREYDPAELPELTRGQMTVVI